MNIVVIGAGPGIGSAVACRFAREGFGVGLIARSVRSLERAAAAVRAGCGDMTPVDAGRAAGLRIVAEQGNAATRHSLRNALELVERDLGQIDVIHYNVAEPARGSGSTIDPRVFEDSLVINVVGGLVVAQWANQRMSARGEGTIMFTGGGLAFEAWPSFAALGAGKAALRNLAQALHKELTPTGVRVGMVSVMGTVEPGGPYDPGVIAEEFWRLYSTPASEWLWERVVEG